jgi:hypothetical protein
MDEGSLLNPTPMKRVIARNSNVVTAFGSTYSPAIPAITLPNGVLDITDGSGLNLPLTFNAGVSSLNTIVKSGSKTNLLTGSIMKPNGLMTVNFRPTGVGAITKSAKGVVLQSSNKAYGAFIGNNDGTGKTNTGAVYLH